MKTNVVMLSPDRELFGIKIRQESKTGHLNLSDLQSAYSVAQNLHGWSQRDAYEVLRSKENAERIFYILEKQGLVKPEISGFMEEVENEGLTKLLKRLKVYRTAGRAANKATWCDPYIWVLVAMELNPMLYAQTVMWLADGLLLNRIEAGNMYRGFTSQLNKLPSVDYSALAKALNIVVFGKHEAGLRQTATAAQLRELADLEKNMAFSMQIGFVRTQAQLLDALRAVYYQKFDNGVGLTKQVA